MNAKPANWKKKHPGSVWKCCQWKRTSHVCVCRPIGQLNSIGFNWISNLVVIQILYLPIWQYWDVLGRIKIHCSSYASYFVEVSSHSSAIYCYLLDIHKLFIGYLPHIYNYLSFIYDLLNPIKALVHPIVSYPSMCCPVLTE